MSINRETLNFLEALDQDAGMQADLEAALAHHRPPIPTIVTFAAEAGFKIDAADIEAVRQLLDTAANADDVELDEAGLDAIAGGFNPQPEPPARISSGNSAILNRSFIHRFFGR